MDARDATANNADLWTHYLRQQWGQLFDPFGLTSAAWADAAARVLAEVAAANVAGMLTMFQGPPIGRMFQANAPDVTRALQEAAAAEEQIEIPAPYAANPKPEYRDLTQREEWVVSSPLREPVGMR